MFFRCLNIAEVIFHDLNDIPYLHSRLQADSSEQRNSEDWEMIVYKYLHPSRTSVLEEGLIRFTQSPALNDPFETTPNLRRLQESFKEYALRKIEEAQYGSVFEYVRDRSRVRSLIKKHLDAFLTTNKNKYAILSLSKTNNSLLMWAHYSQF